MVKLQGEEGLSEPAIENNYKHNVISFAKLLYISRQHIRNRFVSL